MLCEFRQLPISHKTCRINVHLLISKLLNRITLRWLRRPQQSQRVHQRDCSEPDTIFSKRSTTLLIATMREFNPALWLKSTRCFSTLACAAPIRRNAEAVTALYSDARRGLNSKPREFEVTVFVFDDGCAVFDPVAGVAVGDTVNLDVLRGVDVTADHSVDSAMASMSDDLIPKMADMFSNGLQSSLQSSNKRTVSMQCRGSDSAPD